MDSPADLILSNAKVSTLDRSSPNAEAIAIRGGRFVFVGDNRGAHRFAGPDTRIIDAGGRRVIPGINDSHTHVIRGGLTYNAELRWEGVSSVGAALELLREQAARTPAPQWVRVVGGWSEFQFEERRMPTLEEINEAAPDTPVFILHLYARAMLNRAALRALGYDQDPPPEFDRGVIQRDDHGRPTGMLVAKPSALILYKSLAAAPPLTGTNRKLSTRQFMRELNRLGVTSAIDAGGGGQNFPDDYGVISELASEGNTTVRLAYSLFAQTPGSELSDYERWVDMTKPGDGDSMLKVIGAGENLVWSAADFENFLEPRPDLSDGMEAALEQVVRLLAERRWPFRIHATYDESISRFLDVFEKVDREIPLEGLHWAIDHAETISARSIDRIAALGGGVAIQHRMAFQGEYFINRYGRDAVANTPPVRRLLASGVPLGGGTDATRVASYNPWVGLYWLSTGKTLGGTSMYGDDNILEREDALRLYTHGSAWFSSEQEEKGTISEGMLADITVLSADFFSVPDDRIKELTSVLTVVDGQIVYGDEEFAPLDADPIPVAPDWSPVHIASGYQGRRFTSHGHTHHHATCQHAHGETTKGGLHMHAIDSFHEAIGRAKRWLDAPFGTGMGCDCFAV